MERIMLTAVLLTATIVSSFGQDRYDDYKGMNISIVTSGTSKGNVYLDVNESGLKSLILNGKSKDNLVSFLIKSYEKFESWVVIANSNNITDTKSKVIDEMDISACFHYGSKWKFGTSRVKTYFSMSKGEADFIFYTSVTESSDNEYIKSKSTLVRLNKDELDGLLKSLDDEAINEFINKKNSVNDLFK